MTDPPVQRAPVGQLVRAPKTAELIARQLRSQIVRGELRAGDTLPPEMGLMAQFGVSRPTLREAFRILEAESLISVRRGSRGGARVTAPELSVAGRYVGLLLQVQGTTVADVVEARMVLEPAGARLLATRRTPASVAELRAAAQDLEDAVNGVDGGAPTDPVQWAVLAARFHALVMELAGNRTLAVQVGVLQDIIATHMAVGVVRDVFRPDMPDQFRRTVKSYRRLIDFVEAGDDEAAAKHWRAHLDAASKLTERRDVTSVVDLFR